MEKKIRLGIAVLSSYIVFSLGVLLYTFFLCPNIYCRAFNVLPLMPWTAWLEDAARNSNLVYIGLFALNATIAFFAGFLVERFFRNGKK